jgi:hypothetical protein
MHPFFKEKQKFNNWWLWIMLSLVALHPLSMIIYKLSIGKTIDPILIVYAAFTISFLLLFSLVTLKTEINEEGIQVTFFFIKRKATWPEIESAKVIRYGFVGGWGIRLETPYGTVYNTNGDMGLKVKLKTGKNFLIGTQKADELKAIVEHYTTR